MKNIFFAIILMTGTAASSYAQSPSVPVPQTTSDGQTSTPKRSMKVMKVKITGMTCAHGCAKGIEDKVYQLKGVKSSTVDFDSMTGTFIFDEVKIKKEKIISTIEAFNPGEGTELKYKTEVISYTDNK